MEVLDSRNETIEVSTVAEHLRATKQLDEIGGFAFLTQISSRIPTTAQACFFIDTVRRLELLRSTIKNGIGAVELCWSLLPMLMTTSISVG